MASAAFVALLALSAFAAYASWWHVEAREISTRLAEDRYAWWAPAVVAIGFVVFSVVPVMLLISLTGIVFGPVLGPVYALTGCLVSASAAFAVGRWIGPRHVEGWGGERMRRLVRLLRRNGTLAVFLIRKVPLPFVLVNFMLGASVVGYRDFVIGTVLGMAAGVIALAGLGYQLVEIWRGGSTADIARALLFLFIPLSLAWTINRYLRARSGDAWQV